MGAKPRPQEIYRHFKGKLYQIITIATHSETREEMVVYQALYGDYRVYVRPLDMFMSKVNKKKYPDVVQKMRFEKVDPKEIEKAQKKVEDELSKYESDEAKEKETNDDPIPEADDVLEQKADAELIVKPEPRDERMIKPEPTEKRGLFGLRRDKSEENTGDKTGNAEKKGLFGIKLDKTPPKESKVMSKSIDEEAEELNLDPLVIRFMDADLAVEKNEILIKLRPTITNEMIDIMAMSLGVVVNEGDLYDRYNDLQTCLNTIEKFESTRLRS